MPFNNSEQMSTELAIVVPPYTVSVTAASNITKELKATIPKPQGMAYTLHIERPDGASQAGAATIFVVDATNAHFDIPIKLRLSHQRRPRTHPLPLWSALRM